MSGATNQKLASAVRLPTWWGVGSVLQAASQVQLQQDVVQKLFSRGGPCAVQDELAEQDQSLRPAARTQLVLMWGVLYSSKAWRSACRLAAGRQLLTT